MDLSTLGSIWYVPKTCTSVGAVIMHAFWKASWHTSAGLGRMQTKIRAKGKTQMLYVCNLQEVCCTLIGVEFGEISLVSCGTDILRMTNKDLETETTTQVLTVPATKVVKHELHNTASCTMTLLPFDLLAAMSRMHILITPNCQTCKFAAELTLANSSLPPSCSDFAMNHVTVSTINAKCSAQLKSNALY